MSRAGRRNYILENAEYIASVSELRCSYSMFSTHYQTVILLFSLLRRRDEWILGRPQSSARGGTETGRSIYIYSSGLWRRELKVLVSLCRSLTSLQFKEAVADLPDKPQNSDSYYLRWLRGEKCQFEHDTTHCLSSFTCSQELQCGEGSEHVQKGILR